MTPSFTFNFLTTASLGGMLHPIMHTEIDGLRINNTNSNLDARIDQMPGCWDLGSGWQKD